MERTGVIALVKLGICLVASLAAGYFADSIVDRELEKDQSKGIKRMIVSIGAMATSLVVADKVGDGCASIVDDLVESYDNYKKLRELGNGGDSNGDA